MAEQMLTKPPTMKMNKDEENKSCSDVDGEFSPPENPSMKTALKKMNGIATAIFSFGQCQTILNIQTLEIVCESLNTRCQCAWGHWTVISNPSGVCSECVTCAPPSPVPAHRRQCHHRAIFRKHNKGPN